MSLRDFHRDIAAHDTELGWDTPNLGAGATALDGDQPRRTIQHTIVVIPMFPEDADTPETACTLSLDTPNGDEQHGEPGPSDDWRDRGSMDSDEKDPLDESWRPVDLRPALRGAHTRPEPEILTRDDERALAYRGKVNGLHGDSGDGKSWVAEIAAAQQIAAGYHVVWVDFEDDEFTIIERLRELGATPTNILERFHYHHPTAPFDDQAVALIETEAREHDAALVVIDSLGEAFGLEGIDEDRDVQVGPWLRHVARHLSETTNACIIVIDHSTKAKDNPLFPSGSKRKRAAFTGASYLVEAVHTLTREDGGKLRIICAKDRHGCYRRGELVAYVDFHRYPDGGMTVRVEGHPARSADTADEILRTVARAAIRAAKKAERTLSGRELEALMNVKASAQRKRAAIDYAVGECSLKVESGPRRSKLYSYVRDLVNREDAP